MAAISKIPERYFLLAERLGGRVIERDSGAYCRVETTVDQFDLLGKDDLSKVLEVDSFPIEAFTADEEAGEIAPNQLICFDTETTGLGGTGTVPFLIGCGRVTSDGFTVVQYLLPDYADEAAALSDLLEDIGVDGSLVTYNGAAFDLPLVRDRLILNRVARELPSRRHFDLLHPTRRLFRRRLKDCSLINIERELFGHIRSDDIPGYLIPSVYFEWLNDQSTDNLKLVLEHNQQDIITLIYLCNRIARAFATRGDSLSATDDLHSLSRVYGRRRRHERTSELYQRMERETDTDLAADIRLYHANNYKRIGDWNKAAEIWQELSSVESKEGYWSCIELAKYFEHRAPDIQKAQSFAIRALQICPYSQVHKQSIEIRLERLTRLARK